MWLDALEIMILLILLEKLSMRSFKEKTHAMVCVELIKMLDASCQAISSHEYALIAYYT